jgi:limonene-1,2-epoxide hydrolase
MTETTIEDATVVEETVVEETAEPTAPAVIPGEVLAPQQVVERFLAHLDQPDVIDDLIADDIVWENVGTLALPTVKGKEQTLKVLDRFFRLCSGWKVEIQEITADDRFVQTERTDIPLIAGGEAGFWVCGRFEVRDGKIVAWRDRFDTGAVLFGLVRGALRGTVGRVLPSS